MKRKRVIAFLPDTKKYNRCICIDNIKEGLIVAVERKLKVNKDKYWEIVNSHVVEGVWLTEAKP
jgi:hypothetical protein